MSSTYRLDEIPDDFPVLECSKCGNIVKPKKVKFLKRTKSLQILCPECNQYTIAPKDENWEKAIQKLIEMGVITEDDLKTKKDRDERRAEENEDDEYEDELEERDEYDLLKEILDDVSEKQVSKTQKKHILEWAKMKPLEPHEVYSLLIGFGAKEDVAKRISTAYAYALEKEKMKKERYMDAVDTIYRSVTPKSFVSRFNSPSIGSLSSSRHEVGDSLAAPQQSQQNYQQTQQYQYQPQPYQRVSYQTRWYDYGYGMYRGGESQQELIGVLKELINKVLVLQQQNSTSQADGSTIAKMMQSLQEQINSLKEALRQKEFEAELAKRDQEIAELKMMIKTLAGQIGFSQKPEKIQELEVKKETLESLANRVDNAISEVLDFLKWQSAIARGTIPTNVMMSKSTEDDLKSAIERLKKATKKKTQ